ncbi:acetolactate synthase small subunit [Desulfuribacillus stibiiarsenatis]|uniref:Acetolactate synthase small subunit n=1 Tax=Desulfuribacillus stibiiarsenatis TaxID=1390249 RepID=A0A1E5L2Q3_9FIRM|nr:acetolactate synthase small subunit [Desulfuribacillus stibiiarsenatis]OEH84410.1 acetolactate synthase small subunit [Desulfuribacillus stibiiarsenatis]
MKNVKNVISVLVNDQSGVLSRISGLFSRRGFNIDSITVGPAEEVGLSRMTIVVRGDEPTVEQVMKQLHKLIDVIKVINITHEPNVTRELALIKVMVTANTRPEVLNLIEPFRASVVDVSRNSLIVQVVGDESKITAMLELLRPYGIKEVARTGVVSLLRGTTTKDS